MTPAQMIEKYIALRNKLDTIKKQQQEQLAPYQDALSQLETLLLAHLNENQLQSVNGASGTAYRQIATSVTVKNWAETLNYIRDNDLWDLLEARVAKTAAMDLVEERKKPIPGVVFNQAVVVRVRTAQ